MNKALTAVKDSFIVRRNLNQSQFLLSNIGDSIFSPVERQHKLEKYSKILGKDISTYTYIMEHSIGYSARFYLLV